MHGLLDACLVGWFRESFVGRMDRSLHRWFVGCGVAEVVEVVVVVWLVDHGGDGGWWPWAEHG